MKTSDVSVAEHAVDAYTDDALSRFLSQEHATLYRQGAVPRLKRELTRLKKEEPKLKIREAELSEVADERDTHVKECHRFEDEIRKTHAMQMEKLEECAATLAEGNADIEQRKAELKVVSEELSNLEKTLGKKLTALQQKAELGAKEITRMKAELVALGEQESAEAEGETAEVRELEEQLAARDVEAEEARIVLSEAQAQHLQLTAVSEEPLEQPPFTQAKPAMQTLGGAKGVAQPAGASAGVKTGGAAQAAAKTGPSPKEASAAAAAPPKKKK